jgi:hypothetical protein
MSNAFELLSNPYELSKSNPQFTEATQALHRAWHDAQWVIPERPSSERANAAEKLMHNVLKKYKHVGALDTEAVQIIREMVRKHFGMSGNFL